MSEAEGESTPADVQRQRDMEEVPPDVALREHVYLVDRGVRAIALAGVCTADPLTMLLVATRLEACTSGRAFAFVLDRGDGHADYGFAATSWALDLWQWALLTAPEPHLSQIRGLLLGYSVEAIGAFMERDSGRRFDVAAAVEGRE